MKINRVSIMFFFLLGLISFSTVFSSISTIKKAAAIPNIVKNHGIHRRIRNPVMLITIPKSGTHLLEKCLYLMDSKNLGYDYNEKFNFEERWKLNNIKDQLPPDHWKGTWHPSTVSTSISKIKRNYSDKNAAYKSHMWYRDDYDYFLDGKNFRKILLLRDPRAVLVSFANMVKDGFKPSHKIEFEDLLLDLIDGRQKNYIPWASSKHPAYPFVWEVGMCNFYKHYLPFIRSKNCLTIRFENLVGGKGGGSDELQVHEIKQIAQHVGVAVSDNKIVEIMSDLFGGSATFNQGTIDGWKKYFTPVVKEAFKKAPGANALLLALGYERDINW